MTLPAFPVMLLAGGAGALAVSVCATALVARVARHMGFVDHPGGHKSHREPVPYGGGIAIFIAAMLPVAAVLVFVMLVSDRWLAATLGQQAAVLLGGVRLRAGQAWVVLLGGLVLHVMGLIDDRRPLGPMIKLAVIALVSLLVSTAGKVRIAEFAGPTVAVLLTVSWLIVVTNAFNFLDNMDGLSAGVAAICMTFFMACGVLAGQLLVPALACVFLGALFGFLVHNFPPARVFMGDAGSLLIGYMLSIVSILTTYFESGRGMPPYALLMPLVIMAVPLYDFASVVLIRLAEGRNPMKGDQRHFSHRLVDRGLSRRSAVLTIYLATAATAMSATLLPGADLGHALTVGLIVLMVLAIIAILEAPLRKNG